MTSSSEARDDRTLHLPDHRASRGPLLLWYELRLEDAAQRQSVPAFCHLDDFA